MSAEVRSLIPRPGSWRWRNRQFLSSLNLLVSLRGNLSPFWLLAAGLLVVKVLNLHLCFRMSVVSHVEPILGDETYHCSRFGSHVLCNSLPIRTKASQQLREIVHLGHAPVA